MTVVRGGLRTGITGPAAGSRRMQRALGVPSNVSSLALTDLAGVGLSPSDRKVFVSHISELVPGSDREMPDPSGGRSSFGIPNYQRVRDAIRADIIAGALLPGARLKVMGLAQRYSLSQAPIREALNQLEAEGLIIMHPNRGAEVRRIDNGYLREIFEIRLALEPMLVAKGALRAEDVHIRVLTHLQDRFEAAAKKQGHGEMVRLNAAFHATVLSIHPNVEALRLLGYHRAIMNAIRLRFGYAPARVGQIVRDHRALIRCCRAHDAAGAESVMRTHIQDSLDCISRDMMAAVAGTDSPRRAKRS